MLKQQRAPWSGTESVDRRLAPRDDEVSLRDVLLLLWAHRKKVLAGMLFIMGLAYGGAFLVTKQFDAAIVVEPLANSAAPSGASLGALGSNLASLAGLSMGSDPLKVESVAILQSGDLVDRYIQKNNLLPVLFANAWDPLAAAWKPGVKHVPTLWRGTAYFKQNVLSIYTDNKTGLVTLRVRWRDPVVAAQWANGLVALTNSFQRSQAIADAEQNIAYLTSEAAKTDAIGVRSAIYALLESQLDKAMLAKGNAQYAFKIIDPAVASEVPSYPSKLVWMLSGAFAGLSLALFAAFCQVAWRRSPA